MTNFHQSLTNLVQEVDRFLSDTLKSEKLSKSSQKHRDELTQLIAKLREEWPQLNSNSPNLNNNRLKPSDGTDGSSGSGGTMEEDENAYSENIPMVSAKSLTEYDMCGFLQKKRKKGGLVTKLQNQFQRRYCVISKGILYYFDKQTDKKQLGAFAIAGYDFQQCPTLTTEEKKKELCFELVCDGKRTYQFMAESTDDYFKWRLAIKGEEIEGDIYEDIPGNAEPEVEGSAGSARSLGRPPPTPAPPPPTSPPSEPPPDDGGECYDDVANTKHTDQQQKVPEITEPEEVYDDAVTAPVPPPPPSSPRPKPPSSPLPKVPERRLPASPPPPPPPHSDVPLPPLPSVPPPPMSDLPLPPPPDDLPPPPPPSRPPAKPSSVPPPVPDRNEVKPQLAMPFLPRAEDFENLFFGRWDCQASSTVELAFSKGDVIHVLSRDLDEKSWWVGELKGKVGLVPKAFLVNAFELVA